MKGLKAEWKKHSEDFFPLNNILSFRFQSFLFQFPVISNIILKISFPNNIKNHCLLIHGPHEHSISVHQAVGYENINREGTELGIGGLRSSSSSPTTVGALLAAGQSLSPQKVVRKGCLSMGLLICTQKCLVQKKDDYIWSLNGEIQRKQTIWTWSRMNQRLSTCSMIIQCFLKLLKRSDKKGHPFF